MYVRRRECKKGRGSERESVREFERQTEEGGECKQARVRVRESCPHARCVSLTKEVESSQSEKK